MFTYLAILFHHASIISYYYTMNSDIYIKYD